jgi:hypothetical protein
MTITLSITIPSFLSIIVFLVVLIVRRRQVARRDIERVEGPPGNVMQMNNIVQAVQELTETKSLLSPPVTRSSSRRLNSDTML